MAQARHTDFFRPWSVNSDLVSNSRYAGQNIPAPVMAEALSSIWGPGRSREQPSRYQTGFDWKDLMERYEGLPLEWSTDRLTAAMLNERGNILLDYVAPIIPTDENIVRIIDTEMYQLPYDITAAGGVPRSTTYRREAREYSLQQFKRFQTIELAYLQDKNFGASAMDDIMGVLSSQAQLTLAIQVSIAIVVIPYGEINRNLQRRKINYDCARQIHCEAMGFAAAHVSLDTFQRIIERERNSLNGIDTVIMPENTSRLLAGMEGTSRRLPLVEYGYDQKTGRFYRALYEGQNSIKSVVVGGGEYLDFIENPNYRYSILDSDSETTQTLRSFPVLGEMVMQPIVGVDSEILLQEQQLNVGTYDQTDTRITHSVIKYVEALQWAMIWNNKDGSHAIPGRFGDAYNEMLESYKNDKRDVTAAYLNVIPEVVATHDNNVPSSQDLAKSSLQSMEFRNTFTMAATYGKDIYPAIKIKDISMRFLSNRWLERVARAIVLATRTRYNLSDKDLYSIPNIKLMAETFLPDLPRTMLDTLFPGTGINVHPIQAVPVPTHIHVNTAADVLFAAQSHDGLLGALRSKQMDLSSPLVRALEHVPSGTSVAHYGTFFKAANTEGDAGKPAVDRVIAALTAHSLKPGANTLLASVHEHLTSGKTLASFDEKTLPSVRELSKGGKLDKEATLFGEEVSRILKSHASPAALSFDAMDIDEPRSSRPAVSFEFGVFDPAHPKANTQSQATYNMSTFAGESTTSINRVAHFYQTTSLDQVHQGVMRMLLETPNTLRTHQVLASKLGIGLMRLNYWRIFQRYRMLCVSMLRAGERTLAVLFGHQVVTPNLNGAEQYVNIVVQFRAGVVPRSPNSMKLISYPICDKLISDINVQFVRSKEDYLSISTHKPSVVVIPVPIDETLYNFPLHIQNKDIYHISDPSSVNPLNKHSGSDLHTSFVGSQFLLRQSSNSKSADIYDQPMLSLIAYKSWSLILDFRTGKWEDIAGDGPRGESHCNGTNSASVWAGVGRLFPEQPHIKLIS